MPDGNATKELPWSEMRIAKDRYTDYGHDTPSDVESFDLDDSHTLSPPSQTPQWLQYILPSSRRISKFSASHKSSPRLNVASLALAAFSGFVLCLLAQTMLGSGISSSNLGASTSSTEIQTDLVKPEGLKVVGIMFYGRPMFVNVLNCYLQKNMVNSGGWLDEIHFIANTKHKEDLEYLDELVENSQGRFKRIDKTGDWTVLWQYVDTLDSNIIIVKIDDDVVYLHDDAIPRLVTSVLAHPEAFAVGANIINTPHSHFWQYHTGALLPYLPDPVALPWDSPLTWRATQLPLLNTTGTPELFDWEGNRTPLHNMTRWRPLEPTSRNLWRTPAVKASWPKPRGGMTMFTYADEIESWAMAAQIHYSFLAHLEDFSIERHYTHLGNPSALWDQQYERYSINCMAARAGKISRQKFWLNDEVSITMSVPESLKEPFLIDMGAVVSHYSFSSQHELLQTDVLNRYLAYANEMVCAKDAQIVPMVSSMVRTGNPGN